MTGGKNQAKGINTPSVLIVGAHNPLRTSLRDWVAMNLPGTRIVEAISGKDVIAASLSERPDVILFDTGVDVVNGIAATRRIREALPDVKILILTMHENPEYRADAKVAGASDCLLKRKMGSELIPALKDLLSHDTSSPRLGALKTQDG